MSAETRSVELVDDETVGNVARAVLFAALLAGTSYVSFPNPLAPGIPVTLQVLGVFLAGIYLGPRWGGAAAVLYLVAGAIGAPVFAGGASGPLVLVGATGGYLWSYPVAAAVVGAGVHGLDGLRTPEEASLARLVGSTVAATLVVYLFGTIGFAVVTGVGPAEAVLAAAIPFVPMEAFKIAAAVGITRSDDLGAA